jgi:hypothetical protein
MRLIQPSVILIMVLLVMQFIPGIYILYFRHFEYLYGVIDGSYEENALNYVSSCAIFIGSIFFGRYLTPLLDLRLNLFCRFRASGIEYKLLTYSRGIGVLACVLISIYFAAGGYEKFLMLGSDADSWEFRIIGYDDRARFLIVILEISRKFLLPLGLLYTLIFKRLYNLKLGKTISIFIFFQLLAAGMTFDRAPFFILLVVILFPYLLSHWNWRMFFKFGFLAFVSMVLMGGVITNLQYNITDFSMSQVIGMGLDFVFHRFLLIPSITPIELSFSIFTIETEKLWLKYSRLNQLVGGDLVGTSEDISIFVSPVGAIGDIWRNFGFLGLFIWGFILGLILKLVDIRAINLPLPIIVVQYFLVVSLSFYYVMGVFFSQGALLALILCIIHLPLMCAILRTGGASFSNLESARKG